MPVCQSDFCENALVAFTCYTVRSACWGRVAYGMRVRGGYRWQRFFFFFFFFFLRFACRFSAIGDCVASARAYRIGDKGAYRCTQCPSVNGSKHPRRLFVLEMEANSTNSSLSFTRVTKQPVCTRPDIWTPTPVTRYNWRFAKQTEDVSLWRFVYRTFSAMMSTYMCVSAYMLCVNTCGVTAKDAMSARGLATKPMTNRCGSPFKGHLTPKTFKNVCVNAYFCVLINM